MQRNLRRLVAACAVLCTSVSIASTTPPHGCAIELIDYWTGMAYVGPKSPFAASSDAAKDTVEIVIRQPLRIHDESYAKLGTILSRAPAYLRDVSKLALDYDNALLLHQHEPYLDYELEELGQADIDAAIRYLSLTAKDRFPLDPVLIVAQTYEFVPETVARDAYQHTVQTLTKSGNETVLRTLRALRMRELLPLTHPDEKREEPSFDAVMELLKTARWEDWHRFRIELGTLLREAAWIATSAKSDEPSVKLMLWMFSAEAKDFRAYLETAASPDPSAISLHRLLKRSAKWVLPTGHAVLGDFLDHYARAHANRSHTRGRGYLIFDYAAGFFRDCGIPAMTALFELRRDAIVAMEGEGDLPAKLAPRRYDAQ